MLGLALLRAAARGTRDGVCVACASAGAEAAAAGRVFVRVRIRPAGNADEADQKEQAGGYSPELRKIAHTINVDSPNRARG
jgi:hypothetical protein